MGRHFAYYVGDAMTKIGCGLFGGATVAFFFNFLTNPSLIAISCVMWVSLIMACSGWIFFGYAIMNWFENS